MKKGMNKKGAFELSVTTIIIIVIGVTFLILGLTLVRNMFTGFTTTVGSIQEMTLSQIQAIFPESSESFAVSLPQGVATLAPGIVDFGFLIKSSTKYGSGISDKTDMTFTLELDDKTGNCLDKLGQSRIAKWFTDQELTTSTKTVYNEMPKFEGSIAAERIGLTIPGETVPCDQVVYIKFVDQTVEDATDQVIGGSSFKITIKKKSIFG